MQDGGAGGAEGGGGNGMPLLLTILADGEEQARQLGEQLVPGDDYRGAARRLQCTLGRAVAVARAVEAASASSRGTDRSDSPRSADESSGGTTAAVVDAQERQAVLLCKRRKGLPRWTAKFRVPDANLEATPDDGLSWRKYGQKDILGAKFPRGYYRCTYRNAQGCPATKQVQRSDADLCVFDVTYQGDHTCHQKQQRHAAGTAASTHSQPAPQQQEQDHPGAGMQHVVMGFKDVLKVETTTTEAAAARALHGHGHDGASSFCFPSVPFVHHAREAPAAAAFSRPGGPGYDFSSPAPPHCHCPVVVGGSYDDVYDYERRQAPAPGAAESSSELAEVVSRATAPAGAGAGFDYASLYQYHHSELDPHLPFPPFGGAGPSHGPYQ
ncbi:hypothetical protein U9M48_029695 [Paspalum notatum var. saurae]|uniref:WRKY domain-containing protein n=1 Tax=Paspalum notatum var. saurae TaxID=547442 RepID=A0AAQ3X2G1_PASNO